MFAYCGLMRFTFYQGRHTGLPLQVAHYSLRLLGGHGFFDSGIECAVLTTPNYKLLLNKNGVVRTLHPTNLIWIPAFAGMTFDVVRHSSHSSF